MNRPSLCLSCSWKVPGMWKFREAISIPSAWTKLPSRLSICHLLQFLWGKRTQASTAFKPPESTWISVGSTLNLRERGRRLSFSKTHAVCSLSASTISSPPLPCIGTLLMCVLVGECHRNPALCVMIFSPNLFHFLCMQLSFPLKDLDRLWNLKPRKKKFLFSFSFVIPQWSSYYRAPATSWMKVEISRAVPSSMVTKGHRKLLSTCDVANPNWDVESTYWISKT